MSEIFIGALSFERRCIGALLAYLAEHDRVGDAILLDYAGDATPGADALERRNAHYDAISRACAERNVRAIRTRVSPYAMTPLRDIVRSASVTANRVVVDITCMTRPHVLSVAATVTEFDSWLVGYTRAVGYGNLGAADANGGWRDTLVLPLHEDATLRNEGVALGLVLLGHEPARTGLALDELEPGAGIVVSSLDQARPDLQRVALRTHGPLLNYLERLRMPGPRGALLHNYIDREGWDEAIVRLDALADDAEAIARPLIAAARAVQGPIVLYPFGPKITCFVFGRILATAYREASWAVYPIPRSHPLDYSSGVGLTEWYSAETLVPRE